MRHIFPYYPLLLTLHSSIHAYHIFKNTRYYQHTRTVYTQIYLMSMSRGRLRAGTLVGREKKSIKFQNWTHTHIYSIGLPARCSSWVLISNSLWQLVIWLVIHVTLPKPIILYSVMCISIQSGFPLCSLGVQMPIYSIVHIFISQCRTVGEFMSRETKSEFNNW